MNILSYRINMVKLSPYSGNLNDALCRIVDKVGNRKSINILVTLCLPLYLKNILIHLMYAASNLCTGRLNVSRILNYKTQRSNGDN